jgi:hypothetical protein
MEPRKFLHQRAQGVLRHLDLLVLTSSLEYGSDVLGTELEEQLDEVAINKSSRGSE